MEALDTSRAVFVLAQQLGGMQTGWRTNARAQLIRVFDGVLSVRTEAGWWMAAPGHAVWVPAALAHELGSARALDAHVLHADAQLPCVPAQCRVVVPDRLFDALLAEAATFGANYAPGSAEDRLVQVLVDRIGRLAPVALSLVSVREARIQPIAAALLANPADSRVLDELADAAGVTARTAARLFVRDTGITFGQWRQQRRLFSALEALDRGASVGEAASAVGYHDVSSFIAVFREALGATPARLFRHEP